MLHKLLNSLNVYPSYDVTHNFPYRVLPRGTYVIIESPPKLKLDTLDSIMSYVTTLDGKPFRAWESDIPKL